MQYRSPTRHDIGKTVEACADGWQHNESNWGKYVLAGIWQSEIETRFHVRDAKTGYVFVAEHCRVPYTTPDPLTELSIAADLLAENGMDEAARALMVYMSLSNEDKQRLNAYRTGDILNLWQISS